MAIEKINLKAIKNSDIDFSKIYKNSSDAQASANPITIKNSNYWGDEGNQLYYNEKTGLVSEEQKSGEMVPMGYINTGSFIVQEMDMNLTNTSGLRNDSRFQEVEKVNNGVVTENDHSARFSKNDAGDKKITESIKYYDFPCDNEFQDYIKNTGERFGVPHDVMMTIIHQETGGKWDANGVVSPTNDYGLTQINICNEGYIKENLGYTMNDILNDPYKAVEAQALLLKNIMNQYNYDLNNFSYENIFGTYNGWINWKNKQMSVNYASSCMQIYEEKFGVK